MRNATSVCIPCRKIGRGHAPTCPRCRQPMTEAPYGWRPPRRGDERAWKLLAAGQWLTEPVSSARPAGRRGRVTRVPYRFGGRRAAPPAPSVITDVVLQLDTVYAAESGVPADLEAALGPFARHPTAQIRQQVAAHAATPASTLAALLTDADPSVRALALRHPSAPVTPRVLRHAAHVEHVAVRHAVAVHPQSPPDCLGLLLSDASALVAAAAAAHPATRLPDLLLAPFALVPAERCPALLTTFAGRPLRGPGTDAALRLLEDLRTAPGLSTRDALATAAAVLS